MNKKLGIVLILVTASIVTMTTIVTASYTYHRGDCNVKHGRASMHPYIPLDRG